MEMSESEVRSYFNIMYVVFLIYGIILTASIAGAVLGIPMIIGACKFKEAKNLPIEQTAEMRGNLYAWGIFFGVMTLPFGILVFVFSTFANTFLEKVVAPVVIQMPEQQTENNSENNPNEKSFSESVKDFSNKAVNGFKDTFGIKDRNQKLSELKKMYEEEIITKEEYDALRKKVLGI